MSTSVKYFHSQMPGAPVLNNAAGSVLAILDACLINGFGIKTLDSLVINNGIATGTVSTGHSFEADCVAEISGATPAGLNGQKRILSASGNSFTFDATGISNQTATGTIIVKLAPAGWEKPFTGTNQAVYRSPNPVGTRMFLDVLDSDARNARVRGFESMSGVGLGTGMFPTAVQLSGGLFWPKQSTIGPTLARYWVVIADDRTFYYYAQDQHASTPPPFGISGCLFGFGDFTSIRAGEPGACFLSGGASDLTLNSSASAQDLSYSDAGTAPGSLYLPRSFNGVGGAVSCLKRAEAYFSTLGFSGGTNNTIANYPNASDNSLLLNRQIIIEPFVPTLRGVMRGLVMTPQNVLNVFTTRSKVDGLGLYAGRKLMSLSSAANFTGTARSAVTFFDITGPWG